MFKTIPKEKSGHHLNVIWLVLMTLTLLSALIAERATPSLTIVIVIVAVIVIKAQLVIDYFMELNASNRWIYYLMCSYFYIIPLLTILVWIFPEIVVSLTQLD